MPREVATVMQRNDRRVMMTATARSVHLLETLPQELLDEILPMSVPHHIDLGSSEIKYFPGRDPSFVPSVARLGNKKLRLGYILTLLQSAKLKLSSLQDLNNLKAWLARIDFTWLQFDHLRTGFDAVRALSFSDINRAGASAYDQVWPSPSRWEDDIQLARMCRNLRSVEMDVALSDLFLLAIQEAQGMAEAIEMVQDMEQEDAGASQAYQVLRFLELEGLQILNLRFFTDRWNATTLGDGEKRMITTWLEREFVHRGWSVKVEAFGWSE